MEPKKKNSFVLYMDYEEQISMLSDEEAGKLLKGIYYFLKTGEKPKLNPVTEMCFSFISAWLIRDQQKYQDICKKRAESGSKGGKQKQANLANATLAKQKQANLADSDSESDSDTENDIKKIYSNEFNRFWEVYPKKVGKGEAYKKYKERLKCGWKPEELIKAAENYASKVIRERTKKTYIKHPKTFLSDTEPFTDYLPRKEAVQETNEDDPYANWR